jgi:hypothetical protein
LLLHLLAAAAWAAAFTLVEVFKDFETAFYYSLTSYTTVGYGDVVPSNSFRLLGPIEAAVGVLMLGLSTAVFFAAVQQVFTGEIRSVEK